jgi:hypothetical protein
MSKGYYVIGREESDVNNSFNNIYGFNANLEEPNTSFTISGNGNDSYFLSVDVSDISAGRNSRIDIYGEIGINGFTSDN